MNSDAALAVVEVKSNDSASELLNPDKRSPFDDHWKERYQTEKAFFNHHDSLRLETLPILYKEVNIPYVFGVVKEFSPDAMFVFGSSIIKEPLLSLLPPGHFFNMHLGLSPYYRGSGTNFWPFVNQELEYAGATLLHIDPGIDTGDIVAHVTPKIEMGDNVHTVGCKVIKAGADGLLKILSLLKKSQAIPRVKQWGIEGGRYYKQSDFDAKSLVDYKKNIDNGLIDKYLKGPQKKLKLVGLPAN